MKKFISIVLSIMMLSSTVTALGTSVSAAEVGSSVVAASSEKVISGDYEYIVLSDGTAEITDFLGNTTKLTIPSEIDGYTVTSLGYRAIDDCVSLTKVTIPDTITNIEDYVFRNCSSLTTITIPANVKEIGDCVFEGCSSLTSIFLPDTDIVIGRDAFVGTKYYENENNWKDGVLYIGTFLIRAKEDIKGSYKVKAGTKRMGSHAFLYCRQLTEVVFPEGMESIGTSAFCSCTNLKNVVIPEGVKEIGDYAFDWCTVLETISLPDSLEKIGARAFEYCGSIIEVNIPDNVKSIGVRAFDNCTALDYVVIGSGVETIDPYAFNECTSLKHVIINEGAQNIKDNAFYGCSAISHVHFIGTEEKWAEVVIAETGNSAVKSAPVYFKDDVKEFVFAPTCTEDGFTRYDCEVCIYSYTVTHEALGHTMIVDEAVAPTCTETGLTEGSHCSTCEKVFVAQEIIPATGHTEVVDEAYAPTCDTEGRTAGVSCSVCNAILAEQEVIPALGHVWQNWLVLTERLHCRDGELVRVCDVCGDCDFKTVKANHDHTVKTTGKKSATYFAAGYTGDTSCADCGTKISKGKTIPMLKLATPTAKYTGGKKKFTVKYTKVSGATGFQVKYVLGKKTYTKTYNTTKSVNKTINNLKKGTYKVQIRAFVKSGSKTAYSSWTKAKNVKVK